LRSFLLVEKRARAVAFRKLLDCRRFGLVEARRVRKRYRCPRRTAGGRRRRSSASSPRATDMPPSRSQSSVERGGSSPPPVLCAARTASSPDLASTLWLPGVAPEPLSPRKLRKWWESSFPRIPAPRAWVRATRPRGPPHARRRSLPNAGWVVDGVRVDHEEPLCRPSEPARRKALGLPHQPGVVLRRRIRPPEIAAACSR